MKSSTDPVNAALVLYKSLELDVRANRTRNEFSSAFLAEMYFWMDDAGVWIMRLDAPAKGQQLLNIYSVIDVFVC